jgi:hypothetical protein
MLDLKPDSRQRRDDFVQRRVGFEMMLEPAKREFHSRSEAGASGAE